MQYPERSIDEFK